MKYIVILLLASATAFGCSNGEAKSSVMADNGISQSDETVSNVNETKTVSEGKAIHITKADFLSKVMDYEANPETWIYKGDKPCLIDFYADWCGPCKIASPILEELAEEYKGKIYIYKVDTEKERELSSVFGIRSIPAFLFVPQNGKPTMSNGIARTPEETKEMFRKMIDELLLGEGVTES